MLAAESAFGVLNGGSNMETYWESLKNSWIWEELRRARNYRPVKHCLFIISFLFNHTPYFLTR